jgi:hypothetical protein
MMLFDSEGNPCWSAPVEINNWCRLSGIPDPSPVMLFAVSCEDKEMEEGEAKGPNIFRTALMGIDKRSGERRFRKSIDADARIPLLQSFRVSVDSQAQEILFMTLEGRPLRVVKATFTDEKE